MVIGYENGLIEIAFDDDDKILTLVDIVDKQTIPPSNKRINHFNALGKQLYIATNYGISVFNLERLEFGDTYFIGNGGSQVPVNQTAILDDFIYAACTGGNGLRKAQVSSPNLIDFQNWQVIANGDYKAIETVGTNLYTVNYNQKIYRIANDNLTDLFTFPLLPQRVNSYNGNLIVSTTSTVYVYDANFNSISQTSISPDFPTQYTSATTDAEFIYLGTTDFGMLKTPRSAPNSFEEIHPKGPLLNTPFSIKAQSNGVWVTFGEYNSFYNPYPLNSRGYSQLKNDQWINTPFSAVFDAKCLNTITINPANTNQVFISSFFNGLLEVNNDVPTMLYNEKNSGLESLILPNDPNYIDVRVGATVFDKNGLLWSLTSLVDKPLKSFNPSNNSWKSYSFTSLFQDRNLGYGDIVLGADGTKWIASYDQGLIGFKENGSTPLLKKLDKEEQNMPSKYVRVLALDKRNQLWIGTFRGIRVLYNTSNFFEDDTAEVDDIVILEDGIAKELLFQQFITALKVDGSNNKWIGTADSGVFYLSPDGQKTIYHFTTNNSPLPTNTITDISIDDSNGIVYIATTKGLVSFRSGSSGPLETLDKAYAYPNPVRPNFNMVDEKIKIKDISENVNIKITDIEGNLVAEAQSRINQRYNGYNLEIDGGTAYWNGKNLKNNVVASGVYLVMLSNLDTFETRVLKIMVVR